MTALFVRNLALEMASQTVRDIFQNHTNVPILKLKKINHFAFIHYETREAAQTVMDIMRSEYMEAGALIRVGAKSSNVLTARATYVYTYVTKATSADVC